MPLADAAPTRKGRLIALALLAIFAISTAYGAAPAVGSVTTISAGGVSAPDALFENLGGVLYASGYGALCDGTTNDAAAIQEAIDAAPAGATVLITPGSSYCRLTTTLTLAAPIRIDGPGAELRMVTANTPLFEVTSSNVSITGLRLTGVQYAVNQFDANAIYAYGTSGTAPLTNLTFTELTIDKWGNTAIFLNYVRDFDISHNLITNVNFAGIDVESGIHGRIAENYINGVVGSTGNAYGIGLSRAETASLTTDPLPSDVAVIGNVVENIPNWEAYDTHGGQRITFVGNIARNVKIGINVAPTDSVGNVATWAAKDIVISNNALDSGKTDGTALHGIAFGGAQGVECTPADTATGIISGNIVRGFGDQSASGAGGLYIQNTKGLAVTGNRILEASRAGVLLINDNYDFTVSGNTIIDPWSNTITDAQAIYAQADCNTGLVGDNLIGRDTKTATYVLTTGIRIANGANNDVTIGAHHSQATADINEQTGRSKIIGLKVAAPAAANDDCTAGWWAEDDSYLYVCIGADTWERVATATW